MNSVKDKSNGLSAYVSPLGAWALALGTSVGWGSFVITCNTYLSQAGPLGTVAGIIVGMVIMLIISRNYHYMMNRYPNAGGVYTYAKETFGYDQGFLAAWFLGLTYIAVFWANATSLPLFSRYFLGDTFRFGFMYTLFGYDIYVGEILLTIAGIAIIALLCMKFKQITERMMIALALAFSVGISVCFAAAMIKHGSGLGGFDPLFIPDRKELSQVLRIASMSPWAFIGFENISHSAEEFTFSVKKTFRILTIAVISTMALYIFVALLSVTAYPQEYNSWLEYINDLGNIQGIKGLPAFFAANYYLGGWGVFLLIVALFALVVTSLIGNLVALSRLLYALSRDEIIPISFSKLNKKQIPWKTILLVGVVSLIVPFLGRSAIGWIVDVTTLGAAIIYCFVSATTLKTARIQGDRLEQCTGIVGIVLMSVFTLLLLLPNLFSTSSMATESYFLLTVWAILGFLAFRRILVKDDIRRFGKTVIVWIALLMLVLFSSLVWMGEYTRSATNEAITDIQSYYAHNHIAKRDADAYMQQKIKEINRSNISSTIVVVGLFAFSLFIMMNNYSIMRNREKENERALGTARAIANTDPLTGVKSKNAYVEIERNLNSMIEDGTAGDFAIVICDLNNLKQINDTLGHKAGDEYICSASALICDCFKHSPVFRIGGDEFVVILQERDYLNRNKCIESLNNQCEINARHNKVVVATGMAEYIRGRDKKVLSVFERADALMYKRKRELKNIAGDGNYRL